MKNWIIKFAIGRAGNIASTLVTMLASLTFWDSFISDQAQESLFSQLVPVLTILLVGTIQWLGSKWAGENIEAIQSATGATPDRIPGPKTVAKVREKAARGQSKFSTSGLCHEG
jgi:hypothetical protein